MKRPKDKAALSYNEFRTLERVSPETFDYRLGNRARSISGRIAVE